MGQRGRTETLAQVIVELMRARTLSQAELAKRLDVSSRTVRQCILDLLSAGMPIEREEDHPNVFYSVPKDWVPNGLVLAASEARELVRVLARVPSASARRLALMERLGVYEPALSASLALEDSLDARELEILEELEDTASEQCATRIEYYSVRRGLDEVRHISCQRIAYHDRPIRLLAVCHRSGTLKWFRLDRIRAISADEGEPFREADPNEIADVVNNTLFDYHQGGVATEHRFVVHAPEHRWFVTTLGPSARVEPEGESVRVTLRSASPRVIARQLVGLGGAVRVETSALREEVRQLALAALAALPSSDGAV